jgi:hypothetical protein
MWCELPKDSFASLTLTLAREIQLVRELDVIALVRANDRVTA